MKVKLIQLHENIEYHYGYNAISFSKEDKVSVIKNITDWEEVSEEDFSRLQDFVAKKRGYLLLSIPENKEIIPLAIKSVLEEQKILEEKYQEQERKRRERMTKAQKTKEKNRLEKLRRELADLEAKQK